MRRIAPLVEQTSRAEIASAAEAFADETRRRASDRQSVPTATGRASGCSKKMLPACCSRRFCVL